MIFADKNRKDIIGQYIAFCVILKEQIGVHKGDIQKAIRAAIRICIETDNLRAYLKRHEKEVEDCMFAVLSQEEIIQDMVDNAQVEKAMDIAKNLLARKQFTCEEIASITGLSVDDVRKLADA